MERVASVWAPSLAARAGAGAARAGAAPDEAGAEGAEAAERTRRLAAALLAGSPRVMVAGPGLCRVDARGWERRGGEPALARTLLAAARESGSAAGVGIADVAVAADVAARIAASRAERPDGTDDAWLVVPPGEARAFLAPLPLRLLPLSEELRETLRVLGVDRIGWLAEREPGELEVRFGEEGLRAARRARGRDDRVFRPLDPDEPPEVRMELEGPVHTTEPLLFVLRRLLARLCADLAGGGRCAARLRLGLALEDREREAAVTVAPARPTRREALLLELCRAGLERATEGGRLPAPATAVSLTAVERAAPAARQGDLFASDPRDPAAAAGALSRLRAELGEEAVVRPCPRPHHRPEARSGWEPVSLAAEVEGGSTPPAEGTEPGREAEDRDPPPAAVLRLLPEPRRVEVRCGADRRPEVVREGGARFEVVAAEGPERLSGDGWERPFRREYFRASTGGGELLWLFREPGREGDGWWLHGWWD